MERFYRSLSQRGDVADFLPEMMTRAELYDRIGYFDYEKLDEQIARPFCRLIQETPEI